MIAASGVPDLIVLSDLHLGRGRNRQTGRFHRLEAFFYDEDFQAFCAWLTTDAAERGRSIRLVLNGDTFDLLRVEARSEGTTDQAAALTREILGGHPLLVAGLAQLLAAGHEVVLLPGNHDLDLQRSAVQAEVRAAIAAALAACGAAERALERLRFEPWFHHEPGRIWIEHGSQYDPEGSFRFLLRTGSTSGDAEQDTPLGNFFQRHLYNAFGPMTFVVPSTEAHPDYLRWLALHQPRALARVLAVHLPFALRLLRRAARATRGVPTSLARAHEAELVELAVQSGLGDRLAAIDRLKDVGNLGNAALRGGRHVVRALAQTFLLALLALGVWSVGHLAIGALKVGLAPKAALSLALGFVMLVIGGLGLLFFLLRVPGARTVPLSPAATRLAALAEVPLVVFGHTHQEDITPLAPTPGKTAWYFNTGTWIAVFMGDELVPRERVQLSFLRVTGTAAELVHWSPGRGRPLPVVLLDR